jgi:hypothetical protein
MGGIQHSAMGIKSPYFSLRRDVLAQGEFTGGVLASANREWSLAACLVDRVRRRAQSMKFERGGDGDLYGGGLRGYGYWVAVPRWLQCKRNDKN